MSRTHPYIPDGYDHQGRLQPAEACTDIGADTAPVPLSLVTRVRIALIRHEIECLAAEREQYQRAGCVGPIYLRESYAQQLRLIGRIKQLEQPATATRSHLRRTLFTVLTALTCAAALVLAACGGGGSDEEPQPRPQVDCEKKPEQCK